MTPCAWRDCASWRRSAGGCWWSRTSRSTARSPAACSRRSGSSARPRPTVARHSTGSAPNVSMRCSWTAKCRSWTGGRRRARCARAASACRSSPSPRMRPPRGAAPASPPAWTTTLPSRSRARRSTSCSGAGWGRRPPLRRRRPCETLAPAAAEALLDRATLHALRALPPRGTRDMLSHIAESYLGDSQRLLAALEQRRGGWPGGRGGTGGARLALVQRQHGCARADAVVPRPRGLRARR